MKYAIGKVDLTQGLPKICVPVFGWDAETLRASCEAAKGKPYDVIEWRVDYLSDVAAWRGALATLREILPEAPLLATVRTKDEGGEKNITEEDYFALLAALLESGRINALDVEYFHTPEKRKEILNAAEEADVAVIVSSHDFEKTPEEGEMEALLEAMAETGGIPKLAVMPEDPADVLALLIATAAVKSEYPDTPLITMAMSPMGAITRISGETFGSAMTFGSAAAASAPGQLDAETLYGILHALHGE